MILPLRKVPALSTPPINAPLLAPIKGLTTIITILLFEPGTSRTMQVRTGLKLLIMASVIYKYQREQPAMRNPRMYRQLETIIETSLSPHRSTRIPTRLLCSPNVSLPALGHLPSRVPPIRAQHSGPKIVNRQGWKQKIEN